MQVTVDKVFLCFVIEVVEALNTCLTSFGNCLQEVKLLCCQPKPLLINHEGEDAVLWGHRSLVLTPALIECRATHLGFYFQKLSIRSL